MTDLVNTAVDATPSQGRGARYVSYARELYSLAQQRTSKLRAHTERKNVKGEYERFNRQSKRKWERVTKSLNVTPNLNQSFDSRCMFVNDYHVGIQVDKNDQARSQHDIISSAKAEDMTSLGRLQDRIILEELIGPVLVDKGSAKKELLDGVSATSDPSTNDRVTVTAALEVRFQDNLYYDDGATGSTAIATSGDIKDIVDAKGTLERVRHAFRKRSVSGPIYCTLTPELERILRLDSEFNNAERIFKPDLGGDMGEAGFKYRNINFIQIDDTDDIFPQIGEAWGGGKGSDSTGAATAAGQKLLETTLIAKKLSKAGGKVSEGTVSAVVGMTNAGAYKKADTRPVGSGSVAKSADHIAVEVEAASDAAIFFVPRAVYFGDRPESMITRYAERADLSHADQLYMRVGMGALVIEAECVLGLVCRGKSREA